MVAQASQGTAHPGCPGVKANGPRGHGAEPTQARVAGGAMVLGSDLARDSFRCGGTVLGA